MNEIVSNLLVYGSLPEDSILWQLADICEKLRLTGLTMTLRLESVGSKQD